MDKNKKPIKLRRRFVTLIEMMIVMFLIALITGVVAYNYRGTLDEGKAFKTKAGIARLETVLNLVMADNPSADFSGDNWKNYVMESKIVQNPKALMKDGWGDDYLVEFNSENHTLSIRSQKYEAYAQANKSSMFRE